MNKLITCVKCNKKLSGRQKMYCSSKCKNNSLQSYLAQQNRGINRKKSFTDRLGGKCSLCGYCRNLSALAFHHIEPKKKSFPLDLRSLSNRKEEEIEHEVRKCILVCQNCHAELHNPQHSLE